jgi:hypothetical protein
MPMDEIRAILLESGVDQETLDQFDDEVLRALYLEALMDVQDE